jgi:hypothetical protein
VLHEKDASPSFPHDSGQYLAEAKRFFTIEAGRWLVEHEQIELTGQAPGQFHQSTLSG